MNTKHLKKFIFSGIFSENENDLLKVFSDLEKLVVNKKSIKLVYGETYDQYGLTIDSLKFYFILHVFNELLGTEATSDLIIGDTASLRNKMSQERKVTISDVTTKNIDLIKKVIKRYKLKVSTRLMSQMFEKDEYKKTFRNVTGFYNSNSEVKSLFKRTVLSNRLKEEMKKDFLYSREEVSLIVNYDYKIGPPREKNYDVVASKYKEKFKDSFSGIYTMPTYPIGMGFDFFILNPEIDKYGVTPYKAGSNKLEENRITLEYPDINKLEKTIQSSYQSGDKTLPDPIKDLFIIADLARRILESDFDFPNYDEVKINKKDILPLLNKYIFSIL